VAAQVAGVGPAPPKVKAGKGAETVVLLLMGVTVLDTTAVGAMPNVKLPAGGGTGAIETFGGAALAAGKPPKLYAGRGDVTGSGAVVETATGAVVTEGTPTVPKVKAGTAGAETAAVSTQLTAGTFSIPAADGTIETARKTGGSSFFSLSATLISATSSAAVFSSPPPIPAKVTVAEGFLIASSAGGLWPNTNGKPPPPLLSLLVALLLIGTACWPNVKGNPPSFSSFSSASVVTVLDGHGAVVVSFTSAVRPSFAGIGTTDGTSEADTAGGPLLTAGCVTVGRTVTGGVSTAAACGNVGWSPNTASIFCSRLHWSCLSRSISRRVATRRPFSGVVLVGVIAVPTISLSRGSAT
jgi:hypothetical protein